MTFAGPEISTLLERRLNTFDEISADRSYNARLGKYRAFLEQLENNVLGSGVGTNGAYATYLDGGQKVIADSAIIEVLLSLGVLGGLVYFAVLGGLAAIALSSDSSRSSGEQGGFPAACRAVVVALIAAMVGSTATTGEIGLWFWLSLSLCLVARTAGAGASTTLALRS
jgi:hypothetical protein